ncbi:hypothetical protein BDN72DRAFT_902589 [Pluteus cervinus]|uniref:Uncharacterized protein n=1 Tax=Pluteus cervinus TaxID=181527 RepID=A0ACD3ABE9_9AGAR|nr:hypothetical protein BDN72DRAFT_902589 [Pluteus cervinus]
MASEAFERCPTFPEENLLPNLTTWLSNNRRHALACSRLGKEVRIKHSNRQGHRVENSDGTDGRFLIFGQVSPDSQIGAFGDHVQKWDGMPPKIFDSTKVHDKILLECPDDAPGLLEYFFRMQSAFLNTIRDLDRDEDSNDCRDPTHEEWLEPRDSGPMRTLRVYLGQKYVLPENANNGSNPQRLRPATFLADSEQMAAGDKWEGNEPVCTPWCQPDYKSELIEHKRAQLAQLDIRDSANEEIHASRTYGMLRPGALVLMEVRLSMQVLSDFNRIHRVYRIYAEKVRVLSIKRGVFFKLFKYDISRSVSRQGYDAEERYVVNKRELEKRKIMENYPFNA